MQSPRMSVPGSVNKWIVLFFITFLLSCNGPKEDPDLIPDPDKEISQELSRFHQIIEHGSLKDLQQELITKIDVNAPGHIGENALMVAIDAKDLQKMKLLIESGADPELTDDFNATALRRAVHANFLDGVRYLLSLGVERGYHPKYPLKKVDYTMPLTIEMPADLKGTMTENEWKESIKETNELMAEVGENPTVEPIIADVYDVEILNLFLEAGDDLSETSSEMKRLYIGLPNEGNFQASPEDYQKHKSPRFGIRNPERMDNPFWKDMIRIGCNAYRAREHFNDPDPFEVPGAVWCFDRFGSSITQLADGRFVQIGGEHEDYYDPDFNIYNDVVIHDGKGGMELYGYPKNSFPPTDFHTTTLVKDGIYIIGCLGYPDQREVGQTSVYRLQLDTWKIEPVKTSGVMPGWIFEHRAKYDVTKNVIRIEGGKLHVLNQNKEAESVPNERLFELNLSSLQWREL